MPFDKNIFTKKCTFSIQQLSGSRLHPPHKSAQILQRRQQTEYIVQRYFKRHKTPRLTFEINMMNGYLQGKLRVKHWAGKVLAWPEKLQQIKRWASFFFFPSFFFISNLAKRIDTSPNGSLNNRLLAKKDQHVAEPFPFRHVFSGYKNSAKYYTLSSFTRHLFWKSCRTDILF